MKLLIILILLSTIIFSQDLNDEIKDAINKMPMEEFSEIMGWNDIQMATNDKDTISIISIEGGWRYYYYLDGVSFLDSSRNFDGYMDDYIKLLFAELLREYEEVCYVDTLKAILWQGEYIVDRVSYKEMMSMQQLEDNGYKYKYRWFIDNNLDDCLYIFIKEPTLPGLIKWLEE